jgi:16S rRNA (guanine527-N7)-methyltransferase
MTALWDELAARGGRSLTEPQHALLQRYVDLLLLANQRMNLTRITDPDQARVRHIGDALTILPHMPADGSRLVDVGAGGGVPGIPLAIARPDWTVVLVEATRKKAEFLKQTVQTLGLTNVQTVNMRAEDAGRGEWRETFDIAVARAVTTLDWLAEWCLPLVRVGGKVLAMKGPRHAEEFAGAAKAIRATGGASPRVHPVALPGTDGQVIVEIRKLGRCNHRYPRPATQAKGRPIA